MQYTVELLELWLACLSAALKDRSLAFPISLFIGALTGGLFWWLAAMSSRLWNKRFHLKIGLQILCGIAAVLAIVFAVTFSSSYKMGDAVKIRISAWTDDIKLDAEWSNEVFCDAWDEVARLGHEADVRMEPSPRTDPSIRLISMGHPESKKAVVRTYVKASFEKFAEDHPYLNSIISPTSEIPEKRLTASTLGWFRDKPGEAYPLSEGVNVVVTMLEEQAKDQVLEVAAYTRRLSIALLLITQFPVFALIAFFAHRANKPA